MYKVDKSFLLVFACSQGKVEEIGLLVGYVFVRPSVRVQQFENR